MAKDGVEEAVFGMCRFGMMARDSDGEAPVRKTIRVMTNDPGIAAALKDVRCEGGHRLVHLISGRPAAAAIYPVDFCRRLLRGHDVTRKGIGQLAILSIASGLKESEDL